MTHGKYGRFNDEFGKSPWNGQTNWIRFFNFKIKVGLNWFKLRRLTVHCCITGEKRFLETQERVKGSRLGVLCIEIVAFDPRLLLITLFPRGTKKNKYSLWNCGLNLLYSMSDCEQYTINILGLRGLFILHRRVRHLARARDVIPAPPLYFGLHRKLCSPRTEPRLSRKIGMNKIKRV